MGFVERAKSMHERGDVYRAAVILAEGLKREPGDREALEWLLHLYVEELQNPGLEIEVLRILQRQDNGHQLLDIVMSALDEVGNAEKIRALRRVMERERIHIGPSASVPEVAVDRPSVVEAPVTADAPVASGRDAAPQASPGAPEGGGSNPNRPGPVATGENWEAFDQHVRTTGSPAVVDSDGAAGGARPSRTSPAPQEVPSSRPVEHVTVEARTLSGNFAAASSEPEVSRSVPGWVPWVIGALFLGAVALAFWVVASRTAGGDGATQTEGSQ